MSEEIQRLERRLARERAARKEAERLLEEKSLALYNANLALQASTEQLERQVAQRTEELARALAETEAANRKLCETQRMLEQQIYAIDQHTIATVADLAGTIIHANDRFVEISGYSREELIGANHRIVNSGLHPHEMFVNMWRTIASGKVWKGEIRNRRKNGSHYWVGATIVPFLDERGRPYQYFSIRTDITPLKEAEAALQRSVFELGERVKEWSCLNAVTQTLQDESLGDEAILQAAVTLIPPGWLDPDMTCARIRYRGICCTTPGFRESPWCVRANIPNGGPESVVEVFRRAVASESRPFLDEERVLLNSIAAQIGQAMERRHTQHDLKLARDAAEAANRAKSDFLANMSHEIRTPINGILGMTGLALDAESEEERLEYMLIVRHSAESLLEIINDILDFSKIEAGKLSLEVVGFALRATIDEALRPLFMRAREKQLVARCEVADDVPDAIRCDPTRLRQILLNLVSNAVKFTACGEVVVSVTRGAASEAGLSLCFAVRDSGIGIPPEKLGSIFEAFSQADTSTTRNYGGTGLGLTICQQLVRLMGGQLTLESQVGHGSTFRFTLPCEPDHAPAPTAAPRHSAPGGLDRLPALRVLLVEDHPVNQMLATRVLEKWGQTVIPALNGQVALELIARGERFDLVLMDMQMPVMGGVEATQRIRALEIARGLQPHVIIAMTANAMQGDRETCLAAGMDDYLTKPIRQAELAEKLRALAPPAG